MKEKHYGEVDVMNFDRRGNGPNYSKLAVRANVDPNPNYPQARIYAGAWGENAGEMDFGGMCLRVQDAIEVIKMLKQAVADVSKACPFLLIPEVEDLS